MVTELRRTSFGRVPAGLWGVPFRLFICWAACNRRRDRMLVVVFTGRIVT